MKRCPRFYQDTQDRTSSRAFHPCCPLHNPCAAHARNMRGDGYFHEADDNRLKTLWNTANRRLRNRSTHKRQNPKRVATQVKKRNRESILQSMSPKQMVYATAPGEDLIMRLTQGIRSREAPHCVDPEHIGMIYDINKWRASANVSVNLDRPCHQTKMMEYPVTDRKFRKSKTKWNVRTRHVESERKMKRMWNIACVGWKRRVTREARARSQPLFEERAACVNNHESSSTSEL